METFKGGEDPWKMGPLFCFSVCYHKGKRGLPMVFDIINQMELIIWVMRTADHSDWEKSNVLCVGRVSSFVGLHLFSIPKIFYLMGPSVWYMWNFSVRSWWSLYHIYSQMMYFLASFFPSFLPFTLTHTTTDFLSNRAAKSVARNRH